MSTQEPSSARLILTLGAAGLIAGLLLASVYQWAHPIIEQHRKEARQAAIFRVLPGTKRILTHTRANGHLMKLEEDAAGVSAPVIYEGLDANDHRVGYALLGDGSGWTDTISLIFGFDPTRNQLTGMEVLESRETPGLGDKIVNDRSFLDQFKELAVVPAVVAVKKGQSKAPNEVDCITGATISSKAVVQIINDSLEQWKPVLRAPDSQSSVEVNANSQEQRP